MMGRFGISMMGRFGLSVVYMAFLWSWILFTPCSLHFSILFFSFYLHTGAVTERIQRAHQQKNSPMMLLFPGWFIITFFFDLFSLLLNMVMDSSQPFSSLFAKCKIYTGCKYYMVCFFFFFFDFRNIFLLVTECSTCLYYIIIFCFHLVIPLLGLQCNLNNETEMLYLYFKQKHNL